MKNLPKFRIRKPKGLSGTQIGLILFLGVVGGYYIWKPLILESSDAVQNRAILDTAEKSTKEN